MRSMLLILTIFFSVNSFASKTKAPFSMGSEWQLLGTVSDDTWLRGSCESTLTRVKGRFYSDYSDSDRQFIPSEFLERKSSGKYISYQKIEAGCSETAYIVSIRSTRTKGYHTFNVQFYCKPRTFSERVVMNLFKTCVNEPHSECFQEEILKKIDSAKPTQSKDVWLNSCPK